MARLQSPVRHPKRSALRQKEYTYALIAAIFVAICFLYTRDSSSLRGPPAAPHEALPPTSNSVAVPKPASYLPDKNEPGTPEESNESSLPSSKSSTTTTTSSGGFNGKAGGQSLSSAPSLSSDSPRAVIVESHIVPNLIPIMLHFSTVLGPTWGIILFTIEANWIEPLSPAFQRLKDSGHLEVRFLPADTALTDSYVVSQFLTSPWIWEQLSSAKRVLLFQTDSVLCSKSQTAVEEYFQYDFVGAPIASVYGQGYNGGLSLRNPRIALEVARETDFVASGHRFEDQFFYDQLKKKSAALPEENVAKTFAVETIYYETPLGYHQPHRWQEANMDRIEEWCPEVKMLIGKRIA